VGDVGEGDVGLEDLLGDHHPEAGVELRRAAGQESGLARPGRSSKHDGQPGPNTGSQELGCAAVQRLPGHELVEGPEWQAGELANVDEHVALPGHVAVDDVQPGAALELGVLKALGWIQLAV
jgi:hypothetical protein